MLSMVQRGVVGSGVSEDIGAIGSDEADVVGVADSMVLLDDDELVVVPASWLVGEVVVAVGSAEAVVGLEVVDGTVEREVDKDPVEDTIRSAIAPFTYRHGRMDHRDSDGKH